MNNIALTTFGTIFLALLPTVSSATVTYTLQAFSGNPSTSGTFTYISSDFITTNLTVPAPALASCVVTLPVGAACTKAEFYVDTSSFISPSPGDIYDGIIFGTTRSGPVYYFENNALARTGVYESQLLGADQQARLTVAVSSVPEPATYALMFLGTILCTLWAGLKRPVY